jgi:hypothetical protein
MTRLQFRLRTLLIAITVLCVPLAWIALPMIQKRRERAVILQLEALGGTVHYDWQGTGRKWKAWQERKQDSEPNGPTSLRRLLGDDFFCHVQYVHLQPRRRPFIGDIRPFDTLPADTDDDLRLVATFRKLEELDLSNAEIGDEGLVHLRGLIYLRTLDLSGTNVTDAGLRHVKSLAALKDLDLYETKTTRAAVDDLAKALPECAIFGP